MIRDSTTVSRARSPYGGRVFAFPEGVAVDDETMPVLLPLGSLLVCVALWLIARVSRVRDARAYERNR